MGEDGGVLRVLPGGVPDAPEGAVRCRGRIVNEVEQGHGTEKCPNEMDR